MNFDDVANIAAQQVAASESIRRLLGQNKVLFKIADPSMPDRARYELVESADGGWHLVHLEDESYTSHFSIAKEAMQMLAMRVWAEGPPMNFLQGQTDQMG